MQLFLQVNFYNLKLNFKVLLILANATSNNLTSSEILLPNAQATFSNLQMSLSGQVNCFFFFLI